MVAKKLRHLLHFAHILRVFMPLCLAFLGSTASAMLIFDNQRPALSSIVGLDGTLHAPVLGGTWALTNFPTGTSSPVLARNLQRAHRWSHDDDATVLYWSPTRSTSLQSNMARARAFRNQ
jgi:hypothetical protein